MKKFLFLFILSFVIVSFFFAQTAIENPEKPLKNKAGRKVEIQEVLRMN